MAKSPERSSITQILIVSAARAEGIAIKKALLTNSRLATVVPALDPNVALSFVCALVFFPITNSRMRYFPSVHRTDGVCANALNAAISAPAHICTKPVYSETTECLLPEKVTVVTALNPNGIKKNHRDDARYSSSHPAAFSSETDWWSCPQVRAGFRPGWPPSAAAMKVTLRANDDPIAR